MIKKMINKKNFTFGIILSIFLISFISAVGEVSYCCEKTTSGAWCQNAPEGECDNNYRKVPTSCESTSYCKLGTCIDSIEGTCMENTPQKVCEDNKGVWADEESDDIPQCSLGCCLIGEQAAFVTQTRCKRLSSIYGLETNFQTNIGNEIQCIASATSDVKGACVFEKEFEKTCLFLTKKECQEMRAGSKDSEVDFHEGYLCSADKLATNCGKEGGTTCVEGEEEVYFLDTCGNLANIYWVGNDVPSDYWTKVYGKAESCNPGLSNANLAKCGNCDYYLGSTCKTYKRGEDNVKPNYGDNICRDLSCEYDSNKDGKIADNEKYSHGETWCASVKGEKVVVGEAAINENRPGNRHFRLVCYNGDVSVEPCADFRQEVCIQSEVNGFKAASCRVNMWQDCVSQDNQKDCNNGDRRDCQWISGQSILKEEEGEDEIGGSCVPLYAPGFDFWNSEGDAESICSMASTQEIVTYEKGIGGKWTCKENCEYCIDDEEHKGCEGDLWEGEMNDLSKKLGDCGNSTNYFGIQGYYKENVIRRKGVEDD